MTKRESEPRIHASVVTGLLQDKWAKIKETHKNEPVDLQEGRLVKFGWSIVSGLTNAEVMALALGHATLGGVSPGSITFRRKCGEHYSCGRKDCSICGEDSDPTFCY